MSVNLESLLSRAIVVVSRSSAILAQRRTVLVAPQFSFSTMIRGSLIFNNRRDHATRSGSVEISSKISVTMSGSVEISSKISVTMSQTALTSRVDASPRALFVNNYGHE